MTSAIIGEEQIVHHKNVYEVMPGQNLCEWLFRNSSTDDLGYMYVEYIYTQGLNEQESQRKTNNISWHSKHLPIIRKPSTNETEKIWRSTRTTDGR